MNLKIPQYLNFEPIVQNIEDPNRYSETQKPSSTLTIQAKYKDNHIFLKEVTTQGIEKEIFHLEIPHI